MTLYTHHGVPFELVEIIPSLAEQLERAGYLPGAPDHVNPDTRSIDMDLCREMHCPCGRRGLEYLPFNLGEAYRIVARCPWCGLEEEC